MTRLELFDYEFPEELVAQYPAERRDSSRLLVVERASGACADRHFSDLPAYLRAGDVLVLNDSRVMPARLIGEKQGTGARVELFLLRPEDTTELCWEALARPARRLKEHDVICFGDRLCAHIIKKGADGACEVRFVCEGPLHEALDAAGTVPLPPYIHRPPEPADALRYQTVYARKAGSSAAPTAGLHFSESLLDELRERGVQTTFVTLHVGLGTFRPVQSEHIEDHHMHAETYHISEQAAATVDAAKREGRRVICVGTTSVRALESAVSTDPGAASIVRPGWGSTDIFIYPGGRSLRVADALITNFHLPKSTLLMLVSAFYSRMGIRAAYAHAVQSGYRFFSYGDAMLIL
jgi:S-adenosylmethionine:tRNA ribosyltransferase-isomerase